MATLTPKDFFASFTKLYPSLVEALQSHLSSCGYPVYTSIDIRDSGWKTAVVDVNLFPAGFSILSKKDLDRAAKGMREFFSAKLLTPAPWKICVVPEANTNNQGYLNNVVGILKVLKAAGAEPRLLWPKEALPKPWTLKTTGGDELTYLPPDQALDGAQALLLNHDLSGGVPRLIADVNLPCFPSKSLGWYRRRKNQHHDIVNQMLDLLAGQVPSFDPFFFRLESSIESFEEFSSESTLNKIAQGCEKIMDTTRDQYRARGIDQDPFVFIKNNSGTYGMGVFSITRPSELMERSKSLKSKMLKGKESVSISEVIMQEGVPSALRYQQDSRTIVGEPVVYLVNGAPIGGFIRVHEDLGLDGALKNLNQPGSKFDPLECPTTEGHTVRPFPHLRGRAVCGEINTGGVYEFLSRLHSVGASLEECPRK